MSLLRYSTARFGLSPACLVVVVSPFCCSRCRRHVASRSSSSCWAAPFLVIVLGLSLTFLASLIPFALLPPLVSIRCRWCRFDVDGVVSLSLVSIRCRWFRVAAVGFLVVSPLSLLACPPPARRTRHPPPARLGPYTSSSSPTCRRCVLHIIFGPYALSSGHTRCRWALRSSSDLHIVLSGNSKRGRRCPRLLLAAVVFKLPPLCSNRRRKWEQNHLLRLGCTRRPRRVWLGCTPPPTPRRAEWVVLLRLVMLCLGCTPPRTPRHVAITYQ